MARSDERSVWRRGAVRRRADRPFETSDDLIAIMQRALGGGITMQDRARIFQAVRIAVNDEMGSLERALP
jgi:16S rRNA (cytosine1402-N4)-methyltransferase